MEVLRTPDACFTDLPGYPFEPHYVTLPDGLRMHYVDEGPAGAAAGTVLLLHGQPTWSYLYRTVVSQLVDAWPAGGRPRPDRFRPLGQARGADGPFGPGPRRVDGPVHRGARARRGDAGGPGLGRTDRPRRPGGAAGAGPPGGGGQHGPAHCGCLAGRTPGLARPRQRRRLGDRGPDAARLPAPHPGGGAVPAQPLRAGLRPRHASPSPSSPPTTRRFPTTPSQWDPAACPR